MNVCTFSWFLHDPVLRVPPITYLSTKHVTEQFSLREDTRPLNGKHYPVGRNTFQQLCSRTISEASTISLWTSSDM